MFCVMGARSMVTDGLGSGGTAGLDQPAQLFYPTLLSVDRRLPGEKEPKLGFGFFFSETPSAGIFCSTGDLGRTTPHTS